MLTKKTKGIWCEKDRNWYYLETGPHPSNKALQRLRNILIQRELIKFSLEKEINSPDYKIITMQEAREKDFQMIPVYINKHVENAIKSKEEKVNADPWNV